MNWKSITPFVPFFQRIYSPKDDYELGLAYSVGKSGAEQFLLSYNPRRRSVDFRKKILSVFRHFGFPISALIPIFDAIAAHECSWVLGIEQGKTLRATLYIEEISFFLSTPRFSKLMHTLCRTYGLRAPVVPKYGTPYILAIDIHPTGISHIKRYHYIDSSETTQGLKRSPHMLNKPLLIQTRSECLHEKIYACYPYLDGATPQAWEDWSSLATQHGFSTQPFESMPITSLGIRFCDAHMPQVFSLYGCLVVPKGERSAVSSPNI